MEALGMIWIKRREINGSAIAISFDRNR